MFSNIGFSELLIILFIVLLLFGSAKLPNLARSMGSSVSEFKKGMREGEVEAQTTQMKESVEQTAMQYPAVLIVLKVPQAAHCPHHHICTGDEVADDDVTVAPLLTRELKEEDSRDRVEGFQSLTV